MKYFDKFIKSFILAFFSIASVSVFAQAKVEFSVIKMNYINNSTCEINVEGKNLGDRQITLAIYFRVNAKNGDFISKKSGIFELRKGKASVSRMFVRNEKCTDIGSLSIEDVNVCKVEGDVIVNSYLCLKVMQTKRGIIPIKL